MSIKTPVLPIIEIPDRKPESGTVYAGRCKAKADVERAVNTMEWDDFVDWIWTTYDGYNLYIFTDDFALGYNQTLHENLEDYGLWNDRYGDAPDI